MGSPNDVDLATELLPGPQLHHHLVELRRQGPVVPVRFYGATVPLLTTHEAVAAAFRDGEHFPPAQAYRRTFEPVVGRNFQSMEGDEHRLYRRLATPAFRANAVAKHDEATIVELAHEMLDGIAENGPGGSADLAADFTRRFPFLVICRLLGVPRQAEADFHRWSLAMLGFTSAPDAALAASAEFTRYLEPVVCERRNEPRDDIISDLVTAEADGHRLSDEHVYSHIRLLFSVGANTTHDLLGNLIYALLSHPEAWERVLAEPHTRAWAIEEVLRWESAVAILPRFSASEPFEFHGTEIGADSFVLFGITAANRDPAVFSDPDRFDIERRPDAMLSFGPGPRSCPGMHLARKEVAIALDTIIERLPGLHLRDVGAAEPSGAVLRGPRELPVAWD
ncbi:MAG: cytochrome P450 [Deltaproteobacteria bacterium]